MNFYTGVKVSKWSDFNENGLNLIGLLVDLKIIYSLSYTMSSYSLMVRSKINTLRHIGWLLAPGLRYFLTLQVCCIFQFLKAHVSLITVSLISLKSDDFENMTP